MYDPELRAHIVDAGRRLDETLQARAPHLAPEVSAWLRSLAPGGEIASYFTHGHRFPMLLLPWWLAEKAASRADAAFHRDVAYSTIAGYLAIRLLDDALDGVATQPRLLPAGVILQAEFQRAYLGYFGAGHPFWDVFTAQWYGAADFAADHAGAQDFDLRVERRLGPALIPLAAVAYRAGRPDLLTPWSEFFRELARLEQLLDDVTDWVPDSERRAPNIMFEHHRARAEPGEPLASWMVRDGLANALAVAASWLASLAEHAAGLQSAGVMHFLDSRKALIEGLRRETEPGLLEISRLRAAFDE